MRRPLASKRARIVADQPALDGVGLEQDEGAIRHDRSRLPGRARPAIWARTAAHPCLGADLAACGEISHPMAAAFPSQVAGHRIDDVMHRSRSSVATRAIDDAPRHPRPRRRDERPRRSHHGDRHDRRCGCHRAPPRRRRRPVPAPASIAATLRDAAPRRLAAPGSRSDGDTPPTRPRRGGRSSATPSTCRCPDDLTRRRPRRRSPSGSTGTRELSSTTRPPVGTARSPSRARTTCRSPRHQRDAATRCGLGSGPRAGQPCRRPGRTRALVDRARLAGSARTRATAAADAGGRAASVTHFSADRRPGRWPPRR